MFTIRFLQKNVLCQQKLFDSLCAAPRNIQFIKINCSSSKFIDYSRVPVLREDDLEEQYVRGSGPGGQAVNKTNNCIVLKHKPTNIIVKCHMHRMASSNRKEARKILLGKLDQKINGEYSIENQKKLLAEQKNCKASQKRRKLLEMKEKWKQRELKLDEKET